jgi:hypothetical protein
MKNIIDKLILGIILLVVFSIQISPLSAQNEVSDSVVTERLQFLKTTLEHDKVQTQQWWYGWLGLYSAATVVQGAIFFSSDEKSLRQDMALGAATTILGAAGQFISPLIPDKKVKQFNLLPENTSDDQMKKLARAEDLLRDCIKREAESRNWQNHALTTAVNVGGGLITWLGFKRTFGAGFVNFAINEVVTETQIWTSPTFAKRNYKKYCLKYLNQDNAVSYTPEVNWYLEARPGGLGIRVVF